jgi:hypothetical protein
MVKEPVFQLDFAHVTFRQGIVHKPDIRKPGITAFHLFFRTDAEMIELPR